MRMRGETIEKDDENKRINKRSSMRMWGETRGVGWKSMENQVI